MSRRSIPEDQESAVVHDYKAGATLAELGVKYGCSRVGIRTALARAGVSPRGRAQAGGRRGRSLTAEEVSGTLQGYRDGVSVRTLARDLKVRTSIVSGLLRLHGVTVRPSGKDAARLDPAQREEVVRLYRDGASLRALADRFDCSTPTVGDALRRAGIESRVGRPPKWTAESLDYLRAEHAAGRSRASLAEALGMSRSTVSEQLRKLGLVVPVARSKGSASHAWQGGRTVNGDGYVLVRPTEDDLKYCTLSPSGRYVLEHRLVMGRAVGRPLLKDETVHHINGQRDDNRLENLQMRTGQHGKGVAMECLDCGSHNVATVPLHTVAS